MQTTLTVSSFNAFLFQTSSANAYTAFIAQETFTTKSNVTVQLENDLNYGKGNHTFGTSAQWLHGQYMNGKLETLTNKECIDAYAVPILSERRNVIVITENDPQRSADVFDAHIAQIPTEYNRQDPEQFSWLCTKLNIPSNDQCIFHVEHLRRDSSTWTIAGGAKVKYCLSQKVKEHCKLQFSLALMLVVLCTCFFKSLVMFTVAFFVYETPLMTTGDAIESFMRRPDPYTKNMCLASKRFIQNHPGHWRTSAPAYYNPKQKRWHSAIKTRVFSCLLL
jgi:hypothetical protein